MPETHRTQSMIFRRPTFEDLVRPHWETQIYLAGRRYERELCPEDQPIWEYATAKDGAVTRYAAVRFGRGGPYVPACEMWDGQQWQFAWWIATASRYGLEARDWCRFALRFQHHRIETPIWQ